MPLREEGVLVNEITQAGLVKFAEAGGWRHEVTNAVCWYWHPPECKKTLECDLYRHTVTLPDFLTDLPACLLVFARVFPYHRSLEWLPNGYVRARGFFDEYGPFIEQTVSVKPNQEQEAIIRAVLAAVEKKGE